MIVDLTKDSKLTLFKSLVATLGDYLYKLPMSTMNTRFQKLLDKGKTCIPNDSHAQEVLQAVLQGQQNDNPNSSAVLQHLFNDRFSDLPVPIRPDYKELDNSFHKVAFWCCNDVVSDRISSLLNFDDHGKQGFWSDDKGVKVDLKVAL